MTGSVIAGSTALVGVGTGSGVAETEEVDLSEAEDVEVMLGLGVFRERTVPSYYWDTCPGHRDY